MAAACWLCLAPATARAAAKVDFAHEVQPIISTHCYHCHGPDESSRKGKLRLDQREEAIKPRKNGAIPIKPGDTAGSALVTRISSTDPDEVMPPPKEGPPLKKEEVEVLKRWIAEGAPYASHWAFVRPERPPLPEVQLRDWPKNGVDRFILARLEKAGVQPAPAADRSTLIRRVSLDLIGLPPEPADVEAFVQDASPQAYERLVDRLLASPRFGERWARMWLDIARYADSAGYGSDPLRLNIWPYRDWVIRAFNRNLTYDQFSLEQLAGDLLEDPTEDQLIATAFHRNTMTNTEGGTDDEEWRVAAVKDRIAVTAQAWMGVTLHCAQCHSHKFDPIAHKEYYQFYALFNQTEDNDQPDERPTMPWYTPAQQRRRDGLQDQIATLAKQRARNTPELLNELAAWEQAHRPEERWVTLQPESFRTDKGTKLVQLEDGSLLATNGVEAKDVYHVTARTPFPKVTALRLEALSDPALPKQGPGHAGGNFVLNEISVSFAPDPPRPAQTRFVRIELPGKERMLSLSEVQVFSGGTNVALKTKATQSSTDYGGAAALALDDNTDGRFDEAKSTTHTRAEANPWWEVDLGREMPVEKIIVWNRTDNQLGTRLDGFKLSALDALRRTVFETSVAKAAQTNQSFALDGTRQLTLTAASADYSQKDFPVSKASDGSSDAKSGWAVSDQFGRPHVAVFELAGVTEPGKLRVKLEQKFGDKQVLGRFRLSATDMQPPVRYVPERIQVIVGTPREKRTAEQQAALLDWFRGPARATAKVNADIADAQRQLDDVKAVPVPVMRELTSDKRRVTHLLNKGNFLDPGETLGPGWPAAFGPWPEGAPSNRLGVVAWLFSPDNPLTARVAANRFWSQIFGVGLVETEEDFGTQGQLPSHPELLDWLAVSFATAKPAQPDKDSDGGYAPRLGWDMKALLKLIVTSATYQQGGRGTPESLAADPKNRLVGHFPRRRLDAEMLRDQALALSGLLSPKVGGPSVYPPQPDGLWKAAFNGERTYNTSKGEDRYRRGLYTVWRRTVPYPSMSTFDAPSRESCTLRRLPTNTPLQAYVTLNDPVFVECAQALARRLSREAGANPLDGIRHGLRLVLARPAEEAQVQTLQRLYESELAHYRAHLDEAAKLATEPLGPLPADLDPAAAAAWTVVANVLLNLDGVLTKG
jgi:hypothetical protein